MEINYQGSAMNLSIESPIIYLGLFHSYVFTSVLYSTVILETGDA